jgi:hypothetical protein
MCLESIWARPCGAIAIGDREYDLSHGKAKVNQVTLDLHVHGACPLHGPKVPRLV